MNCEYVEELLSVYLDNVLAREDRQSVASHLQSCPACRGMLADFRHFDALLFRLPRVQPGEALQEKIFFSPEYLELTGTYTASRARSSIDRSTLPYKSVRRDATNRPQLIALPGGRNSTSSELPTRQMPVAIRQDRPSKHKGWRVQHILQVLIVATLLLTIGVGSFIGWHLLQAQSKTAQTIGSITPPAGPPQGTGPLPAGMHFVFLRNGALWSGAPDNNANIARLTPASVTVAPHWAVRPALPGRKAGDLLAYIDLQQGYVHTIRSDGQSDTVIQQPLLKSGVQPASIWSTDTGTTILNSLTWSTRGNMLAFIADPNSTGQRALYLYSADTGNVHRVSLPIQGAVSHPTWSPDGIRLAFELSHNGTTSILDYNTQNQGILTIASSTSEQQNTADTLLNLDWSPSTDTPAITWSLGMPGHIHSVWMRQVGTHGSTQAYALAIGDYTQATYSQAGHSGMGSWLLVQPAAGHAGDVLDVDLNFDVHRLTTGKQVSFAQWSPDGTYIDYFNSLLSNVGALHILNTTTGVDTLVSTKGTSRPAPVWSIHGQNLLYSTGMRVFTVEAQTPGAFHPLSLQGSVATFVWSAISPSQVIVAINGGQQGIYLLDIQRHKTVVLSTKETYGPLRWTQVP